MKSRRAFLGGLSAAFVSAPAAVAARDQARVDVPRPGGQPTLMAAPSAELNLLRRITNGVTADEINTIYAFGYNGYLDMQLNPWRSTTASCDSRLAGYTTMGLPTPQLYALDSNMVQTQVIESTILRAIYSKRQLFERMVEFWTDHFNTDINTVGILKTADVRDVLRGNALDDVPRRCCTPRRSSPAMINRLNNQQNSRTAPNQNYAREVMELHTLGVDRRLHAAGHRRGRALLHRLALHQRRPTIRIAALFLFNQSVHDTGTKLVLGNTITSTGVNEGLIVLRILADHPSTHRFVVEEAAALVHRLRALRRAGRRRRRGLPPERRRHQDRRSGASSPSTTCAGRRRCSSARSTTSSPACAR